MNPHEHEHENDQALLFFSTRPSLGLLPVLGPLGSGTDTTHQPSPALRLLGFLPCDNTLLVKLIADI